jgi:spore germination protein KC
MKRIIPLLLIVLLLTGCRNSSDINERVIVQGIGIDRGSTKKYLVTVQALNKDTYSGIGGTKVPENLVENYFLEGDSVAEALAVLPQRAGKKPLYTHTRIVVIGNDTAKDGLNDIIDFFARDSSCSARMFLAVCDGEASRLLSDTEDKESIPSVEMENAVKSSRMSLNTLSVHIYEFLKMFREETTNPYLPLLRSLKKDEETEGIDCNGVAVFEGDREIYEMGRDETAALKLLSNNVREGTYSVLIDENTCASFNIYKYAIKKAFRIDENGRPVIMINIKCIFDNVEYASPDNRPVNERTISEMQSLLREKLEKQLSDFLEVNLKEKNTDCARMGRVVLMCDSDYYKQLTGKEENRFSDFVFDVRADVTVRRIGQLN